MSTAPTRARSICSRSSRSCSSNGAAGLRSSDGGVAGPGSEALEGKSATSGRLERGDIGRLSCAIRETKVCVLVLYGVESS